MRPLLAALSILLCAGPAAADTALEPVALELADRELADRGQVVEVIDGDTVRLDDGREVRLVGLQAPKLPLGRSGFEAWPLADEAKRALAELTLGREVGLGYGGRRVDRHGRALGQLYRLDGAGEAESWVQGAMLEAGLARVYSFADNRALVADMLERERLARAKRRGIWADPFYAVRAADGLDGDVGSFQVVEGVVLDAAEVRGRVYLNFGEDWKSDFTVTLAPAVRRLFASEGIDPLDYGGKTVRVRGWVKSFNGPMIEASHPEQIEVVARSLDR
ncbi:MAG: thermonuclease family protein [Kiloniellales bacterium]|nr:thermonuclease family protein [Kiloniellales bacterium]